MTVVCAICQIIAMAYTKGFRVLKGALGSRIVSWQREEEASTHHPFAILELRQDILLSKIEIE